MFTSQFWLSASDRAAKSAAQALLLLWGADAAFNLLTVEPLTAVGVAGGAAALSVLTSIASAPFGSGATTTPGLLPGSS